MPSYKFVYNCNKNTSKVAGKDVNTIIYVMQYIDSDIHCTLIVPLCRISWAINCPISLDEQANLESWVVCTCTTNNSLNG